MTIGVMAVMLTAGHALTATFTDIGAGLTGIFSGSTAWGDYDNDGDLDIVVVGRNFAGRIARIYRNTAGSFADAGALPVGAGLTECSLAWGDYDRDGDLDLVIGGNDATVPVTRIFRNNAGTFADIGAVLVGVRDCAVSWADYDNDGDLDVALAGGDGNSGMLARIYRNTAGTFTDAAAGIAGLSYSAMAWADYDLDRDLDLIVSGTGPGFDSFTTLYRNTGGTLSPVVTGLPAVNNGAFGWADYDNDGDPDLLISGSYITEVWRNTAGSFASAGAVIQGLSSSSTVWGDYDNDGRMDIAEAGATGSTGFGAVYRNTGSGFTDISAGIPNLFYSSLAWGDYDKDGDLDLMMAGADDQGSLIEIHRIYRVAGVSANAAPSAPTGLSVTTTGEVTFSWNASTDAQGAPLGLTYNLWAGTAAGTPNVMAPMSNLANGFRRVAQNGNVGQKRQWTLPRSAFPNGQIHWGVQAVDQAFAGSAFTTGPSAVVSVEDLAASRSLALELAGSNPSRTESRMSYALPHPMRVELAIFDITGRRLQTLVSGERDAGRHEAIWNGEAADGSRVVPGLYFARLSTPGAVASLRILRIE